MAEFVYADPRTGRLLESAGRLSGSRVPVLISGETGTGKEVLARYIHAQGPEAPFVVLDCSVLNGETARSEIFGAARGAYTGADRDRAGLVEAASGGTLFIDEVGEAGADLQMMLLRFLQGGEFRRVGETRYRRAAVRVIAATNRDLDREVERGRFRQDLLYRIRVAHLPIPPLRERRSDISALLEHFVRKYAALSGTVVAPSPAQRRRLLARSWPGNARELENAVALIAVGMGDEAQGAEETGDGIRQDAWLDRPFREARRLADEAAMRTYLEARLAASCGNVTEASRSAGIGRQYFQAWMTRVGIQARAFRRSGTLEA